MSCFNLFVHCIFLSKRALYRDEISTLPGHINSEILSVTALECDAMKRYEQQRSARRAYLCCINRQGRIVRGSSCTSYCKVLLQLISIVAKLKKSVDSLWTNLLPYLKRRCTAGMFSSCLISF